LHAETLDQLPGRIPLAALIGDDGVERDARGVVGAKQRFANRSGQWHVDQCDIHRPAQDHVEQ